MKKNLLIVTLAASTLPVLFQSCGNKGDEDVVYYGIATVENPDSVTRFSFVHDNGTRLNVTESDLQDRNYKPADGQRIIPYYTILPSNAEEGNVRLLSIYEVLTKGVFEFTPGTTEAVRDSIGNDPVELLRMWVGSHYLNVEFVLLCNDDRIKHFINLVSDQTKSYTDNKVHLEFRHNDNDDYPSYRNQGIASFDLRPLQGQATDSINLVVHVKEYGTGEKTHELTYKFAEETPATGVAKPAAYNLLNVK
ncbi:MAG: NigD-like protein [Prevotellaceae bacterium]|nr:NigD-like protein [Prevotellaceae bacterium]